MVVKFNRDIKFLKFVKNFKIKGNKLNFNYISGNIILRSNIFSFMRLKELESSRRFLRKFCRKKNGKLHIRVTPFQILTYKSVGVRMGKGKGKKVKDYLCRIKPGQVLFEFEKNIKKKKLLLRIFLLRMCNIFFLLKKRLSVSATYFFKV